MLLFLPLGDSALQIEFSKTINKQTIIRIRSFVEVIESKDWEFIIECVPSYTTLTIFYDPIRVSYAELVILCKELEHTHHDRKLSSPSGELLGKSIEIPVLYGGDLGPDLDYVARYHRMTAEQVIELHTNPTYLIYLIGFTPGFPYLGGMSNKIATPRLSTPRLKVPAGSVGIANHQTGIYSVDSPGGWRIIGQTPLKIFESTSETPFLFKAGDFITFKSIDKDMYDSIREKS